MLEFTILDFVLTSSLCYLCGIGTGLVICCRWKDHIAMKSTSSQNDLQTFASPPIVASAPPPATVPGIKVTYE